MEFKFINRQLDFNLLYANELVKDVNEDEMTFCPSNGFENHPAFTLGHLAVASSMTIKLGGGSSNIPDRWILLFNRKGPGDTTLPENDSSKYPNKSQLLNEFARQHEDLKQVLSVANPESYRGELEWRFNKYLPTNLDCIIFMCLNHEAMHLGQLAAWRRAMKLPSALARL